MRIYMKKQGTGAYKYDISPSFTAVNEGQSVTFTIVTQNVLDGTELSYQITGISEADIVSGNLTGTTTVTSNLAEITLTVVLDQETEGTETILLTVDGTGKSPSEIVQVSSEVTISDTSQDPTYFISSSTASVNEGQSVTFTVTTTDIFDNTLLPYTITGISQADLSSGNLTGNVNIVGNTGTATVTLALDATIEPTETLTFTLDGTGVSKSVTVYDMSVRGSALYSNAGSYSWTCPAGVTSVSVVAIGGGGGGMYYSNSSSNYTYSMNGGGGGGLGWKNNISVTPGQSYAVVVGAGGNSGAYSTGSTSGNASYFINASTVQGGGGAAGRYSSNVSGGSYVGDGGGQGGYGQNSTSSGSGPTGGGGAGGYTGTGGWSTHTNVYAPTGGGGAAGYVGWNYASGGGGGTGVYGQGANGVPNGRGGSGGSNGVTSANGHGGWPGGGGGGSSSIYYGQAGNGARGTVRIVWGNGRAFPSTDVSTVG